MRRFGLIGKKLSHSFSKNYFTEKFEKEGHADHVYDLFELDTIEMIREVFKDPDLQGLNVTIPYKTQVIPYLSRLDERAERIGAVNVIAFSKGEPVGYNSDYFGFKKSLEDWLGPTIRPAHALILGTGGASRAVKVALEDMNIRYSCVSRTPEEGQISYASVDKDLIRESHLIINTTPLGMAPDISSFPQIPYEAMGPNHYLYDLVYNPETTRFLKKGKEAGTRTMNGLNMLLLQAEASWRIWNK